jgi:hypothetical protein
MDDLRTSAEWYANLQKYYTIQILDYDGWDRDNFDYSFKEELITSEEFDKRLEISTLLVNNCPYSQRWDTFSKTHQETQDKGKAEV